MSGKAVDDSFGLRHRILGAAIAVHRSLGPGLLESAYQACLEYELFLLGMDFKRQVALPVVYRGVKVDCGYRVDLIVEDTVMVEVKAVESVGRIHVAQVITYLKLSGHPVGLLLNFNVTSMRQGIRLIVNPALRNEATSGDEQ